ncbi:unnamed protein product, partial [Ilex paraguariensis]
VVNGVRRCSLVVNGGCSWSLVVACAQRWSLVVAAGGSWSRVIKVGRSCSLVVRLIMGQLLEGFGGVSSRCWLLQVVGCRGEGSLVPILGRLKMGVWFQC